jgi:hypothetical protein
MITNIKYLFINNTKEKSLNGDLRSPTEDEVRVERLPSKTISKNNFKKQFQKNKKVIS